MAKDTASPKEFLLQIRRARRGDVAALTAFNLAMAWETEKRRLDMQTVAAGVAALFKNPQLGFYVVAESERQVVGALMITFEWSDWRNAYFWWIQSVYVKPRYRGRGIYRRLHEYVQGEACRCGNVCGLRLYVEKTNEAAQATYKKLGMDESHYAMYESHGRFRMGNYVAAQEQKAHGVPRQARAPNREYPSV